MEWDQETILRDPRFVLLGRRNEQEDPLRFFWPGSGVAVTLQAQEMSAIVEADWGGHSPWMSVLMDGVPVSRFPLRRGIHEYALLTGMEGADAHRISLIRDTQPMEDDERLTVRLCGLKADAEPEESPDRLRIEFVGDSLTSGEGLAGPVGASEWKTVWMSAAYGYAAQVCALLGADGEWVSQSGWGVVTDWNQDRQHVLPSIYGQVCALQSAGRRAYDFAAHPVDAVVVNLGTNDMTALSALVEPERTERAAEFLKAVGNFCRQLRSLRPGTPVLWVCGMCGNGLNGLLECAVRAAAETISDSHMVFMALPSCKQDELGSLGHPGYLSHRRCAELIAKRLKQLIEMRRPM